MYSHFSIVLQFCVKRFTQVGIFQQSHTLNWRVWFKLQSVTLPPPPKSQYFIMFRKVLLILFFHHHIYFYDFFSRIPNLKWIPRTSSSFTSIPSLSIISPPSVQFRWLNSPGESRNLSVPSRISHEISGTYNLISLLSVPNAGWFYCIYSILSICYPWHMTFLVAKAINHINVIIVILLRSW